MAIDALRRATSGDPDSAETGEALAMERRILKARRALEKSVAALNEGRGADREPLDDGAAERPRAPVRGRLARRRHPRAPGRPGPRLGRRTCAWSGPPAGTSRCASSATWPRTVGPLARRCGRRRAFRGPSSAGSGRSRGGSPGCASSSSPPPGSTTWPPPCAATRPLVAEPARAEPPFNGHLTLARAKGSGSASPPRPSWPASPSRPASRWRRRPGRPPSPRRRPRLLHAGPGAARLGPRRESAGRPGQELRDGRAMAAAAACWNAGVTSSAGVGRRCACCRTRSAPWAPWSVEAGQVVAGLQAVDAVVGAHRHRRAARRCRAGRRRT